MEEYKNLQKIEKYDEAAVEELAQAKMEKRKLEARLDFLDELINENEELRQFVWTTAEGISIPLHKLETDHLSNILGHIANQGRQIPKAIKAEARKRDLVLPDPNAISLNAAKQIFNLPPGDEFDF